MLLKSLIIVKLILRLIIAQKLFLKEKEEAEVR